MNEISIKTVSLSLKGLKSTLILLLLLLLSDIHISNIVHSLITIKIFSNQFITLFFIKLRNVYFNYKLKNLLNFLDIQKYWCF